MYVIEPHPNSSRSPYKPGWQEWWANYPTSIDPQGYPLFQPRTFKERVAQAKNMIRQREITHLVLIDEMDNPYWSSYGYMPNCAYLIDRNGIIFYRETWFARGSSSSVDNTAMKNAINALLSGGY
jgi:hypothetical protein